MLASHGVLINISSIFFDTRCIIGMLGYVMVSGNRQHANTAVQARSVYAKLAHKALNQRFIAHVVSICSRRLVANWSTDYRVWTVFRQKHWSDIVLFLLPPSVKLNKVTSSLTSSWLFAKKSNCLGEEEVSDHKQKDAKEKKTHPNTDR